MPLSYDMGHPSDRNRFTPYHFMTSAMVDGTLLVSVSGIVLVDLVGRPGADWTRDNVTMFLDVRGAIPEGRALRLLGWTPLVTVSAASGCAHAVDRFGIIGPEEI